MNTIDVAEIALPYIEKEWIQILNAAGYLSEEALERYAQEPVYIKVKSDLAKIRAVLGKETS